MKLRLLGDRVLVKFDEIKRESKGGIILPSEAREKPIFCTILAIGPEVLNEEVKNGVKAIVKGFAGTDISLNDENVSIIKENDIIAIIKEVE